MKLNELLGKRLQLGHGEITDVSGGGFLLLRAPHETTAKKAEVAVEQPPHPQANTYLRRSSVSLLVVLVILILALFLYRRAHSVCHCLLFVVAHFKIQQVAGGFHEVRVKGGITAQMMAIHK